MKYCDCIPWRVNVAPYFQQHAGYRWDSSKAPIPMYFGVKIDFCPFCGRLLQDESLDTSVRSALTWPDLMT